MSRKLAGRRSGMTSNTAQRMGLMNGTMHIFWWEFIEPCQQRVPRSRLRVVAQAAAHTLGSRDPPQIFTRELALSFCSAVSPSGG